jgi:transposase
MYVRKSTRKYKKGKTYTNYLLVESVHTPKGPRQKVVCSLGDLSPRPRSEWLKLAHKVEEALVGQIDLLEEEDTEVKEIVRKVKARRQRQAHRQTKSEGESPLDDLVAVHVDQVTTGHNREAGPVHVGYSFWKRLGLEEILKDIGLGERARTLTCAMTMARLVHPCSEYAMPDWIRRTALEDILGADFEYLVDDALYRNLDKLYPKRASIEYNLVERERTLFNLDQTVFFYDLTSTYFEGEALANPKAKRGYSRDKRPDCKQVVVGLVVNRDGFPLAHEIFEGNRQDRKTVGEMLDVLDKRVGLKESQTVVVDRGMAYEDNIAEIRARKLHYIVASRQPERECWLSDFEDEEGFGEVVRLPSPRNPYQEKTPIYVKMKSSGEETYVLCVSSGRKEKDRAIREKQEGCLLSDLARLEERIQKGRLVNPAKISEAIGRRKERYPRVARYYRMEYDEQAKQLTYPVDEEKRGKAEELDGSYLLKTDRQDLSAEEVWRIYTLLTRAEKAFRNMKSPLAERPIFHQIERRVETHIFLCVLAYHLLVAIEKTLLDKGVHTSWGTVKEILRTHQVTTVVLPADNGSVLRIRKGSTPEPQHKEIYNLLGVPSEVMRPKKTWDDPKAVT